MVGLLHGRQIIMDRAPALSPLLGVGAADHPSPITTTAPAGDLADGLPFVGGIDGQADQILWRHAANIAALLPTSVAGEAVSDAYPDADNRVVRIGRLVRAALPMGQWDQFQPTR